MVIIIRNEHCNRSSNYWMRLIAFCIALILLGKIFIQLFSLQQWVNNRLDWILLLELGTQFRKRKTLNSNQLNTA